MKIAAHGSRTRPIRNRPRVSRNALYQSMSVLPRDRFEEYVLQRQRLGVDADWVQAAGFVDQAFGAATHNDAEDAMVANDANQARRSERRLRGRAIEHQLDAPIRGTQIVQPSAHGDAPAIDDRDPVGDLIDLRDLMR